MLRGLIGGGLIGVAATLYWAANGRIAGISGILRGALWDRGRRGELAAFLGGLVAAGLLAQAIPSTQPTASQPIGLLLPAGLLVGFGTRLGGGCTSGHGVCGISRLSFRALVATATFVATGAIAVFVAKQLVPGLVAQ